MHDYIFYEPCKLNKHPATGSITYKHKKVAAGFEVYYLILNEA